MRASVGDRIFSDDGKLGFVHQRYFTISTTTAPSLGIEVQHQPVAQTGRAICRTSFHPAWAAFQGSGLCAEDEYCPRAAPPQRIQSFTNGAAGSARASLASQIHA
jgi:hypothetical protein